MQYVWLDEDCEVVDAFCGFMSDFQYDGGDPPGWFLPDHSGGPDWFVGGFLADDDAGDDDDDDDDEGFWTWTACLLFPAACGDPPPGDPPEEPPDETGDPFGCAACLADAEQKGIGCWVQCSHVCACAPPAPDDTGDDGDTGDTGDTGEDGNDGLR